MGVGIAFLRPKADGTWEGDCILVGRTTFGELQDLIFSLPCRSTPLYFREDEYEIEVSEGAPPYPARVSPELAEDLKKWLKDDAPGLLAELRRVPEEEINEFVRNLKSLVEERLAEGYAIMVSF